jgi:RHS repeat-associated protein
MTISPFERATGNAQLNAGLAAQAAAASPTGPPFTECPADGADTSCGVLVVVTDSGFQVLSDPSQGPLDGADDTLTGVLNSSSNTVSSLALSANTVIFGFDGDGLCTASPRPSGCPFGTTGYEGPGVSFTNINPSATGGIVRFSGGIPPGGSGYFSLEMALTAGTVYSSPPTPPEQGGPGNPGEPPVTCSSGMPVNCATGTFWHTWDDLRAPGRGVPLDFQRTYSSAAAGTNGPLGFGWTDSYNMSLSVDGSGNVTVSQEDGATVTFNPSGSGTYVAAPRVLATLVKNGDGTYTFTRNGDLVHYTFSSVGQLVKEVDRNGYATTLAYNGSGQLTAVTEPAGRTFTFTYSGSHVATVTGPGPRTESFTYDASGNLQTATNPLGGVWTFSYDSNHQLLTMKDPNGGVTTNVYDASGRVTSQTDPMNRKTTWSYSGNAASPAGGTTTMTSPRGEVTTLQFQNLELLSKTKAAGTSVAATTSYAYDPATLGITQITDPDNHTSTFTYDAKGNQLTATDALNRTTTTTYNGLNEPLTVKDPSGVTTTRTYDANGNLLSLSRPLNSTQTPTTVYHYDDASHPGDLTSVTDPNGHTTAFTYDSQGDLASVTDAAGDKTTSSYDALGELTSSVSPRGNVSGANPSQYTTTFSYDLLGRVTQTVNPLGHSTSRTYDADGNVTSSTDSDLNKTSYAYDLDNELTKVTRADSTTMTYGYDSDGNQTSQTNGAGRTTSYGYDPLERVSSITDPLNRTTTNGYDPAGNLTSVIDPSGRTTTRGYDAANELTSITYSDGTTPNASFTYTANGLKQSMSDGTGTTSYSYDQLNRLTSQTNGNGQTVAYGYDLVGNLTSLTYPNFKTVSRSYDSANRLIGITDWLGHTTSFTPDPDSNVAKIAYPNGITSTSVFDAADQLSSITDTNSTTTVASFGYTRDNNGQLKSETPTGNGQGGSQTYSYNQLNRLTTVNTSSYGYNSADDLTRLTNGATLSYDAADEVTNYASPSGSANFKYDQNGNRIAGQVPTAGPASYAYDGANRLISSTGDSTTIALAAGGYHSLALGSDGTVWAWGRNGSGQLGNGSTTNSSTPVAVSNLTKVTAIAAGESHSLALKSDGTVWDWGAGGLLGNGSSASSSVPVQVSGLTGVVAIAAGDYHSLALKADGTVWAWGSNQYGALGNGTTTNALTPVQVSGLTGVTAIAGGSLFSLAVKSDGTAWAWGYNVQGQLGNGSTTNSAVPVQVSNLSGVTAVAAAVGTGGLHGLALKSDGTVWAWGNNANGQLGNGTYASSNTPVKVSNLTSVTAIAAGVQHSVALKSDGSVWAWGRGGFGALGINDPNGFDHNTPIQVTSLSGVTSITASESHNSALKADGTLWGWGENQYGQVGDGTTTNALAPVRATSGRSAKTTYGYDGAGLRSSEATGGITLRFAWDVSASVPLLLTNGTTSYIYDNLGLPVEQIDAKGAPLYYQHDQLGSTRLLTDQSGNTVATYTYDAYGNETSHTGGADTPLRWAGQYQDASTGFYYLRARYYDPQTGQFVTRDPLAPVTQAPYAYAGSNPLNLLDLTGLGCGWNPFCYIDEGISWVSGEIAGGVKWAWEHPEDIALGVATATLLLTPFGEAELAVAFTYTLETADTAAALSVDIEGSLSVADLLENLGTIGDALGFVGLARACTPAFFTLNRRNASECAWGVTDALISGGIKYSSLTDLEKAVLEWIDAAYGVVGHPGGRPRPC